MKGDDLSDLTVFLTVAEERSFTRAGKRLGVSPSAISHAMRNLEEQIGVRLLSRTTRSVASTPAGEQLLARASGRHRHTPRAGAGQRAQGSPLRASAPSPAQIRRDDGTSPQTRTVCARLPGCHA